MPTVSSFYGIAIRFYHRDHGVPHFHAFYGGHSASISIESFELLDGWLPPRAFAMVLTWAHTHRQALFENWSRARMRQPLQSIEPLH